MSSVKFEAVEDNLLNISGLQVILDSDVTELYGVDTRDINNDILYVLMPLPYWSEYRNPDFDRIKAALKSPNIVDGRNLYNPERMMSAGFIPLGRLRHINFKAS